MTAYIMSIVLQVSSYGIWIHCLLVLNDTSQHCHILGAQACRVTVTELHLLQGAASRSPCVTEEITGDSDMALEDGQYSGAACSRFDMALRCCLPQPLRPSTLCDVADHLMQSLVPSSVLPFLKAALSQDCSKCRCGLACCLRWWRSLKCAQKTECHVVRDTRCHPEVLLQPFARLSVKRQTTWQAGWVYSMHSK